MRNSHTIDKQKIKKSMDLGKIYDAKIHMKHIQSVLDQEISNNRMIIHKIKKENRLW